MTRAPLIPARTTDNVRREEAASAASAPSHTLGLPARKVINPCWLTLLVLTADVTATARPIEASTRAL